MDVAPARYDQVSKIRSKARVVNARIERAPPCVVPWVKSRGILRKKSSPVIFMVVGVWKGNWKRFVAGWKFVLSDDWKVVWGMATDGSDPQLSAISFGGSLNASLLLKIDGQGSLQLRNIIIYL